MKKLILTRTPGAKPTKKTLILTKKTAPKPSKGGRSKYA